MTYIVRADGKHWSNMFVLGMALIDLYFGGFVLPMRFISAYGSPLTQKLCAALAIGESSAMGAAIYAILFMIYTRLYDLQQPQPDIRRRYLILLLFSSWIALFLFYGIPFMINYSSYLLAITSPTLNTTSYCTTYTTSVYRPPWMAYTEIGAIYSIPILFIVIGLICLIRYLCQARPRRLEIAERKIYVQQRQMTWHVFLLGLTFLLFWLPWISMRIVIIFYSTRTLRRVLQITYYILVLKSVLFPILYAATNTAFRGSFAIYRHERIIMNNRVWSIHDHFGDSLQRRRGY